jgi:hypothetical protein
VSSQLVYVSLPPGSLSGGDSVVIVSSGLVTSEPMANGGFDPLAAYASASDSVAVTVWMGTTHVDVLMAVPEVSPPKVVRTAPPKGRRDIPLNQMIVIVFSEPIDPSTVTSSSVQLITGGSPVAATLTVLPNEPWVVRIAPTAFLAPNATYTIQIDGGVKEVGGLPLGTPVSSDFTTGTSADSVASVAVWAIGGFARQPSSVAVATPGGTVQYTAYEVSLAGDTLLPTTSSPIAWSTSDPTVARIDSATGLLTAVSSGGATVHACTGAICGDGSIIVDVLPSGIAPQRLGDLGAGYSRLFAFAGGYATGYALTTDPDTVNHTQCRHAFLWSAGRGMEDIDDLPGNCYSVGWNVNSVGTVLGYLVGANFIWTRATGMQTLADPDATHGYWSPSRVNEHNEISWGSGTGAVYAFQSPASGLHVNPTPADSAYPVGLNKYGRLAFNSNVDPSTVWVVDALTGSVLRRIQRLDPISGLPHTIVADDINDNDEITGSIDYDTDPKTYRWSPSSGFEILAPVGPGITVWPLFMNSAGDVTLYLDYYRHIGADSLFEARSAIWMANGTVVMLGGLGGTHTFVNGINDNHQAAGHSQVGSNTGPQEAVLWDLNAADVVSGSRSGARVVEIQPRRIPVDAGVVKRPHIKPRKGVQQVQ